MSESNETVLQLKNMKLNLYPIVIRLTLALACLPAMQVDSMAQKPLTHEEIIRMLKDAERVPNIDRRVAGIILLIEKYKISSPFTRQSEYSFIEAGATYALIASIRDYSPTNLIKPVSPELLADMKKLLKYDEIRNDIEYYRNLKFYEAKYNGKWGYIDRFGNEIVAPDYDSVDQLYRTFGYAEVTKGDRKGVIDLTRMGRIVVLEKDVSMLGHPFTRTGCEYSAKTNKGLFDRDGNVIISTKFVDSHCEFSEGLIGVSDGNKWGFANKSEQITIPLEFGDVSEFSNGLAAVYEKCAVSKRPCNDASKSEDLGKCGYIDKTGKQIISYKYDECEHFIDGTAIVGVGKALGMINKSDKMVIPIRYTGIVRPPESGIPANMLQVCGSGSAADWYLADCGLIDLKANAITPMIYHRSTEIPGGSTTSPFWFKEGIGWACDYDEKIDETKCALLNDQGKIIIPPKYSDDISIDDFYEGMAVVTLDDKTGFVDKSGKELAIRYDLAYRFSYGLAKVCKHFDDSTITKCGFINRSGVEVTELKYDWFRSDDHNKFTFGFAMVRSNGKYGFLDRTGKEVIPLKYDEIWLWDTILDGIVGVKLNGKKGFVDVQGNEYFD